MSDNRNQGQNPDKNPNKPNQQNPSREQNDRNPNQNERNPSWTYRRVGMNDVINLLPAKIKNLLSVST